MHKFQRKVFFFSAHQRPETKTRCNDMWTIRLWYRLRPQCRATMELSHHECVTNSNQPSTNGWNKKRKKTSIQFGSTKKHIEKLPRTRKETKKNGIQHWLHRDCCPLCVWVYAIPCSVRPTVNCGNFLLAAKAITAQNGSIRCEPKAERNAKRKTIRDREMCDHIARRQATRIQLGPRSIASCETQLLHNENCANDRRRWEHGSNIDPRFPNSF